jgi:hypothetical protein
VCGRRLTLIRTVKINRSLRIKGEEEKKKKFSHPLSTKSTIQNMYAHPNYPAV